MEQTGPQQSCPAVPGKMMNCSHWAHYEPRDANTPTSKLCHGGFYERNYYEPCPVRSECYTATIARKTEAQTKAATPILNNPNKAVVTSTPQPAQVLRGRLPLFRAPDLATLPTRHAQARNEVVQRVASVVDAAVQAVQYEQTPVVVPPMPNAPAGMRTAFLEHDVAGMAPIFLPAKGQSTFDRILKNMMQSVIAAIGYTIWSSARRLDLFDDHED